MNARRVATAYASTATELNVLADNESTGLHFCMQTYQRASGRAYLQNCFYAGDSQRFGPFIQAVGHQHACTLCERDSRLVILVEEHPRSLHTAPDPLITAPS